MDTHCMRHAEWLGNGGVCLLALTACARAVWLGGRRHASVDTHCMRGAAGVTVVWGRGGRYNRGRKRRTTRRAANLLGDARASHVSRVHLSLVSG